ncbi:glycosyltransferase family 2 protein [Chryseobacterium joostei]|uniref:Glycosyltransferase family 2 protein n=1 Tax=Chryseobacterium joostei TaxID=112234 RepID=A0A1N7I3S9_9FLAO|nr:MULTISPECIES: glycosyltransferase [Chryseobacterium]AZB02266.1 glycosyltransferase family 2 protein [Chryseobacterium joostei]SIS31729.1 Glycosyltransferase, GT2 family [Chryseobacterium joostei]HCM33537.1 glycosyltransferase family 2 protein [Chryseobacterium sp.]
MIIPFICVNYNSHEETIKYIDNVLLLDINGNTLIVVVDNSPTDVSFNILKKYVEEKSISENKVVIIKKENRGYFQGLNDGIEFAQKKGINNTYFVVGNNDITFEENFIIKLLSYHAEDADMVIAPDVITTEGSHENPHVIDKMSFLRKLKYDVYFSNFAVAKILGKIKSTERRFNPHDPIKKKIYMGIGALYILTPNFFKHYEKLSEEVFLYGEEAILTGQINKVNGNIIYDPELICYHNESSTTSKMNLKHKYKIVQKSYKIYRKYL